VGSTGEHLILRQAARRLPGISFQQFTDEFEDLS